MSLFDRDSFEALVLSLPETEIVHQWGDASVGKVRGKIFALMTREPKIAFKCTEMAFALLPELKGIAPARYLARAKWVEVAKKSGLTEDEIEAYIVEAHRLIAEKGAARLSGLPKVSRKPGKAAERRPQ